MRVTQSMLSNNNLKYISQSYDRLSTIQEQMNSGKKISKPSEDPVIAMKGMRYRTQLAEVEQFKRNLNEGFNWMDNADAALDEANQVLHSIRELVVQASNDTYDPVSRGNIAVEIGSLQEHLVTLANTKVGNNYIFNGTDTASAPINKNGFIVDFDHFVDDIKIYAQDPSTGKDPDNFVISYKGQTYEYKETTDGISTFIIKPEIKYDTIGAKGLDGPIASLEINTTTDEIIQRRLEEQDGLNGAMIEVSEQLNSSDLVISTKDAVSENKQNVEIEVMKGVAIPINITAQNAFSIKMFSGLESIKKMLTDPETQGAEISKGLDTIDGFMNGVVSTRAELGAKTNRAEMIESRLLQQEVVAAKTVSDNEDVDLEKVIIDLTIQESIHRVSLAVGARILQPTLMDFLR